jgi:hypothetical protein
MLSVKSKQTAFVIDVFFGGCLHRRGICCIFELLSQRKLQQEIKDKVKFFLCLTKHYAMKTYGGVDV